jgi:ABC-2 type transport system permease protein
MASIMLSCLGIMSGIWADKFDQMAGITNFVITPLAFLSGTFYSIQRLPEAFQIAAHFNPFFYMIDGFRYGVMGHADGSLTAGILVLAGMNILLWSACYWMFKTGYKLKS